MVKRIVRYVCEICGTVFDDEKMANKCEAQPVQSFNFDINEEAVIITTLFPEKVEIIERYRSHEDHQNIYLVKRAVGWEEAEGEEKSIVSEKDMISLVDYEKKISEV